MKALIIDDEPLARSIVREYLQKYPQIELVQECIDGFEGVKAIQLYHPDLIFLDIQMPKINGFEMLELIENPPATIFTTAFDEYAIRAFESHAVDYLLKPFSQERFDKAMQKWMNQGNIPALKNNTHELLESVSRSPVQSQRIVVKTAGKIKIIPVEEVHFIEASDDYVKIHTREGNYLKNKTMNHFEQLLDSDIFIRTHRSFIVNVQEITRIEPMEKDSYLVILKTGMQVPVSKSGYAKLKQLLGL